MRRLPCKGSERMSDINEKITQEYDASKIQVLEGLEAVRKRNARFVDVDRPVQSGDTIDLDFEGFVDGVAFEGGKADNYTLEIGSGAFIPGFEDQLVGLAAGQEGEVKVTFPEQYAENLAGKDAVFKVKVHTVREPELPELDDEFAKDVSEFDTLADYRADIEKRLTEQAKNRAENERRDKIIETVCENATVDIPQPMVERQIDQRINEMEMRMRYQGLKLEDFLKYTGQTLEQIRANYEEGAKKQVLAEVVLDAIREAEGIDATDQEG